MACLCVICVVCMWESIPLPELNWQKKHFVELCWVNGMNWNTIRFWWIKSWLRRCLYLCVGTIIGKKMNPEPVSYVRYTSQTKYKIIKIAGYKICQKLPWMQTKVINHPICRLGVIWLSLGTVNCKCEYA